MIAKLIEKLRRHYGPVKPLSPKDPFQLVIWEHVAYLADDTVRAQAFAALKKRVGLAPEDVASAPLPLLSEIARMGGSIAVPERASRMRETAEAVIKKHDGSLKAVLKLPYPEARRKLKAFPSIGPPGADKILLLTGAQPVLALDSNALRVLLRLGYGEEQKSYAASYASAQAAATEELPNTIPALTEAFVTLQHHGRELCRRNHPECPLCPVRPSCPFGGGKRILA